MNKKNLEVERQQKDTSKYFSNVSYLFHLIELEEKISFTIKNWLV